MFGTKSIQYALDLPEADELPRAIWQFDQNGSPSDNWTVAPKEQKRRIAKRPKRAGREGGKPQPADDATMIEGLFDMASAVEGEIERLGHIKAEIEDKAEQLTRRSRYQLDFLASMSDELLAPLESILVLAKRLADDDDNNLLPTQIDYAQTIYSAGTHLQALIGSILDLAKMESSAVTLEIESERFVDLRKYFMRTYRQTAQEKGLSFEVELVPGLPAAICTDGERLRQILDNLLSNAFKFTGHGGVTLRIAPVDCGWTPALASSDGADQWVGFSVVDTGAGIAASRQKSILDSFHHGQEEHHSANDGAGLGLSICHVLARMLDGEIRVSSKEGMGSCFTLYLPLSGDCAGAAARLPSSEALSIPAVDRRDTTDASTMPTAQPRPYRGPKSRRSDDGMVLIFEGDVEVASQMLDVVRSNGYQGEVAADFEELKGLMGRMTPDAVLIGMKPDDDGAWAAFDLLKRTPETRQLPLSVVRLNGGIHKSLQMGGQHGSDGGTIDSAIMASSPQATLAGLSAACGRPIGKLLIADATEARRADGGAAWRLNGAEVVVLGTAAQIVEALRQGNFDAMVLGAALDDMSADDLVKNIMAADLPADLPIAMTSTAGNGWGEIAVLRRHTQFADVLSETTQFLHRVVVPHPSARQEIPASRRMRALELAGRKALIVDDIRNIFAITGMLEQQGMTVLHAEDGAEGIDALRANPDTDVVLVDTTVAELDSHGLIDRIRGIEEFKSLPIIAVTDKATPANRWEYIGAGASDTIDKPVNIEQLLSLLRVWVVKER